MPHEPQTPRVRAIAWLVVLSLIIGLGAYKANENQRDRDQQAAYQQELDRLEREGSAEYQKLSAWTKDLFNQDNARQATRDKFNGGKPWPTREEGDYEVATWQHPNYGIELQFTFNGDNLVGFGASTGTSLLQKVMPEPPAFSRSGPAEEFRRWVPPIAGPVWIVAFAAAVFAPRLGRVAAELMLAASLATAAAHVTAPYHSLSARGLLTNDALFFTLVMYLASVVMLAVRTPPSHTRVRFGVRDLLLLTTAVAVLLALGAFGVLSLAVLCAGVLIYAAVRRLRPVPAALPAETVAGGDATD